MRQSYTDFSSTTPLTTIPVTQEATMIAIEISSSDFSSVEPRSSTSVPNAPDSTTPTISSGQESQDLPVPKDRDNVSAFGIGNQAFLLLLT